MGNLEAAAAPASEGERWRAVPRRLSRKSEGNSEETKKGGGQKRAEKDEKD